MINMGNIKKTLSLDTQLLFTYFFKKRVLAADLLYYEVKRVVALT